MNKRKTWLAMILIVGCLSLIATACSGTGTPNTSPSPSPSKGGGGAVVQSDSIISGEIKVIRQQTTGYPWEVDVLIQSAEDVDSLPNPVKDKVGQVVTAKTDEDLSSFHVAQQITARVKYVGDVPLPGISLYIYNIKSK